MKKIKIILAIMWIITLILMAYSYYLVNDVPYFGPLYSQIETVPQAAKMMFTISAITTPITIAITEKRD